MKIFVMLPVALLLAGCTPDDAVGIAAAGLGVAAAASGASSGGGGYGSSGASVGPGGTGNVAPTSGYNQRQSFEDCRAMYQAAGMYDLGRKCTNNATNMNSLNRIYKQDLVKC